MLRSSALAVALVLLAPPAAACASARAARAVADRPEAWRKAVEALLEATGEPGHPWSCSGGEVDLVLEGDGARLRVAREGEPAVERHVRSPDEVVPLGKALLALPAARADERREPPPAAPPPPPRLPPLPPTPPPSPPLAPASSSLGPPSPRPARLWVGGGLDGRHLAESRVGALGVTAMAAVPLGRWLPGITLRRSYSIGARPPMGEMSAAIAVAATFPLRSLELRAGPKVAVVAVGRDVPHRRGDDTQVQARVGGLVGLALPKWRFGRLVVVVDGEVTVSKRRSAVVAQDGDGDDTPRPFPVGSLGGALLFEVPL